MTRRKKWYYPALRLSVALLMAGAAHAGIVTYEIYVNTASVSMGAGYLDFQFNPGAPPFDAASATLTNFSSDATLLGALGDIGAVTGSLPGTVEIDNTNVDNEYTESVTYGSFFDVFVTLDIPVVSGTATGGSSFALSVWDTSFAPLLTGDPLVEIDLDATSGAPTPTNNSVDHQAVVGVAPEPGAVLMVGSGLVARLARRRKPRASGARAGREACALR